MVYCHIWYLSDKVDMLTIRVIERCKFILIKGFLNIACVVQQGLMGMK